METMNRLLNLFSLVIAVICWTTVVCAAPIDDLVAAAKKEGAFEFYAPSTLTPRH